MRRDLTSWLRMVLTADWPPAEIYWMAFDDGSLTVTFQDDRGLDATPMDESTWEARYDEARGR